MQNIFAKILYYYGLIQNNTFESAKIICPFHNDIKPSMIVNLTEDRFYCFGCNVKGNHIDFVQQIEKVNSLQALKIINTILSDSKLQNIIIKQEIQKNNSEHLKDAWHYFKTLPVTNWQKIKEAKNKLRSIRARVSCDCASTDRHIIYDIYNKHNKIEIITKEDIDKYNYMLNRGFNVKTLIQNNIKINYDNIYGITCPMYDNKKFKGYVNKAIVECDKKYKYNKGFERKNTLVGNYYKSNVIITEGYMDLLKLKQYGFGNSVAILGWKITDKQISKLQQITNTVISALDNTETGEEGSKYLSEYFKVIRWPFMCSTKDVGEMDSFEFNQAKSKLKRKGVI